MFVCSAFCGFDSVFEHLLGFSVSPCVLKRLGSHKVAVGVIGMEFEQLAELFQRGSGLPEPRVLHGQSVAGKGITGVLPQKLGEHRDAIGLGVVLVHSSQKFYPIPQAGTKMNLLWHAHTSFPRKRFSRSAGLSHTVCLWAAGSAALAGPASESSCRMRLPCESSVMLATLAAALACRPCAALIPFDSPWPGTAETGSSCITSMTASIPRWLMGNSSTTAPQSAGF